MRRRIAALLCCTLLLPAGLAAQSDPTRASRPVQEALQPGDVLQVRVWREADLGGDFVVDESGEVILPLLGKHRVAGVAIDVLRDELLRGYGRYLRNPAITITPLRRVNVLGEVNKPGLYPVDATVTLAGAIGVAGGASANGDLRRIRIVRDGQVYMSRADQSGTLRDMDIRSGDQIIVERRSWFDRNSTFVASAMLTAAGIVTSIIINN